MKLENCIPHKCRVCGEFFSDGWEHVLIKTPTRPFLHPRDKEHADAIAGYKSGVCPFCGGTIQQLGNQHAYEIICPDCQFLFDED